MNNKILISLISLIAFLGIVFFLIIPLCFSVNVLKTDLSGLEQEQIETEKFLTRSQQLEQNYLELEEEAQKVFLSLPEGKDIPYLLIQFENLVEENGLLLGGIRFDKTAEEEKQSGSRIVQPLSQKDIQNKNLPAGVLSLSVNVETSGSYGAFKNYLNSLESNIRSMDVEQINLKSQDGGKNSLFDNFGIFQFILKINTYYQ